MKQTRLIKMLVAGTACAVALSVSFAQDSSTTSSTTTTGTDGVSTSSSTTSTTAGTGTITAYTPGSDYITFRTETSTAPVKYYYTKKTVVVDAEGKTVDWSLLRPDLPVRYEYVKDGDRMVVSRVVVTKPLATFEKKETTTTTTTAP
ncbi:MAG: hypothetical protein ABJB22_05910 [Verrucomicrobiota bacterium]